MHFRPFQKIGQKTVLSLVVFSLIFLLIVRSTDYPAPPTVHQIQGVKTGHGGSTYSTCQTACAKLTGHSEWHIPQSWVDNEKAAPECKAPHILDITDAAECALHLALVNEAFIDNSNIPLIAHQTSRSAEPETWSSLVRDCIESWLTAAIGRNDFPGPEMAWLMWDDAGVDALVQKYEPGMYQAFSALPYPVEKADAFRILVLKWFGGVVSGYHEFLTVVCKSLTLISMRTLIPNP
jgi:hypothetical protein